MLSALLFTALLGAAALSAEAALRAAGRQARWPWLFALVASVTWPMLAPFVRRSIPETGAMRSVAMTLPSIQVVPDQLPAAVSWTHWVDVALVGMWAVASLVVLARLVHALVILARIRRASRPQIVDGVPVLVSVGVGPAVVGVVKPRVLFPEALLELDAPLRQLVLRHEQEHCRARDQWIVVGAAFALALVPWNLPLWWIVRRARLALEVDCDARVLTTESNTTQYAKLLLLISQRQRVAVFAPMLAASSSHLERRIAAMLPIRSNRRGARIVIALVAMVIAGIAACTSRISDPIAGPTPVVADRAPEASPDQPYFEFQVTKAVRQIPGTGNIRYPDALRAADVEGVVLAQFVVDANGQFEPGSFKVLRSNHGLFTQAVEAAIPNMRFYPAELRTAKVRQLVQQPFTFSLSKSESRPTSPAPASSASPVIRADAPSGAGGASLIGVVRPARGVALSGTRPTGPDQPYMEFQVTKVAQQIPGTGNLRYPDSLRKANVQGEVLAEFVVDADGRFVPGSFIVLKSSHDLFSEAVKTALPNMRFIPAEYQGKRVKQTIQQPWTFSLSK
jgi:TonB family protein